MSSEESIKKFSLAQMAHSSCLKIGITNQIIENLIWLKAAFIQKMLIRLSYLQTDEQNFISLRI